MADSNDSSKNSKNLLVWIIVVFVFIGAIAIFVVSFQKNTTDNFKKTSYPKITAITLKRRQVITILTRP